jgi:hypothetical protein
MRRWLPAALLSLLAGCIIIKPPEKPVHLIVDVNLKIKVERELDQFFDFQEEAPTKPEAKPEPPAEKK